MRRSRNGYLFFEFDMLRKKAEVRMVSGGGFPGEFVSVRCVRISALSRNGGSVALASSRSTLAVPEASGRMRRLFGPRRSPPRRDVFVVADMDAASGKRTARFGLPLIRPKRERKKSRGRGSRQNWRGQTKRRGAHYERIQPRNWEKQWAMLLQL